MTSLTYPNHPGAKVSGASRDAGDDMAECAPTLRERVLDLFATREWTADEAAAHLGESVLAVRPRFSELRRMGLISETGFRRANTSGMTANVWRRAVYVEPKQQDLL